MLQPLGLPLCLPSHLLSSIRLNTFSIRTFLTRKPSSTKRALLLTSCISSTSVELSHSLAIIINVLNLLIN